MPVGLRNFQTEPAPRCGTRRRGQFVIDLVRAFMKHLPPFSLQLFCLAKDHTAFPPLLLETDWRQRIRQQEGMGKEHSRNAFMLECSFAGFRTSPSVHVPTQGQCWEDSSLAKTSLERPAHPCSGPEVFSFF
uniref:Uncharacterized protein n=1 Tax=Sphaerodactylus townsendi TaxID=933632 RepID=A0ACB8FLG1_9SAUR